MACGAALICGAMLAMAAPIAAIAARQAAAPRVDIDARVSYETRQVMANGVSRVDTWQERLVRRGNQVWTERILPASGHLHDEPLAQGKRAAPAGHAGHAHFNAETSARWLTLLPDGNVEVRFVDREHKVVVKVPRAEFGTLGFDGRFDAAASIVPPSVVRGMKPASGASAEGEWRVDRSEGWTHRVLWSEPRQLAMRVESKRDDGSIRRVVTVQLQPSPAGGAAPWSRLTDYTPKQYDDFMD